MIAHRGSQREYKVQCIFNDLSVHHCNIQLLCIVLSESEDTPSSLIRQGVFEFLRQNSRDEHNCERRRRLRGVCKKQTYGGCGGAGGGTHRVYPGEDSQETYGTHVMEETECEYISIRGVWSRCSEYSVSHCQCTHLSNGLSCSALKRR